MTARQPDNLPFPPLPAGRFPCGAIDIAWHYQNRGKTDPAVDRNPQRHYPTMSVEHAMTLPIRDVLAPDAFLHVWITGPHLALGSHVRLADAWRMKLSSIIFVWLKTKRKFDMNLLATTPLMECDLHNNTGYTSLQNCEYVVLMRCGSPRRIQPVHQTIIAPVSDHSRKPVEFFRRAEIFSVGPRIDMFAGAERPGWTAWGNPHRPGERSDAA